MSIEGAMLGGSFLPEQEFKDLMKQVWDQQQGNIKAAIHNCILNIESGNILMAYKNWELFQTDILKNPKTQILAITNFYNHNGGQQWQLMDEVNSIETSGLINVAQVDADLKRIYCSEILAQHLSGLFKSVSGGQMTYDEICYCYEQATSTIKQRLNQEKYGDKTYTYKEGIYGGLFEAGYRGKVADAYLNHLGALHWNYLDNFLNKGTSLNTLEKIAHASVEQEERSQGYYNFLQLLLNSLNTTGWQTGGDLIVANSQGQIVANIQLKTSGGEGASIGHINTSKLLTSLQRIEQLYNNPIELINNFYNLLKTSAIMEQVGDAVIQTAYDLAEKNLKLK